MLVLLPVAAGDIKDQTVDMRMMLVVLPASAVLLPVCGQSLISASAVLGTVPGLFMLALSLIPGEPVGRGDGLICMWLGVLLGPVAMLEVLLVAWAFAFLVSSVKVLRHRRGRLPFIPFLTAAFACLFFPMVWSMCV